MADCDEEQERRLNRIAEHLSISSRYGDAEFTEQVTSACLGYVSRVAETGQPSDGEGLIQLLAHEYHVRFEEVSTADDVEALEQKYLREKKELGFGQLSFEFEQADRDVDALLFQRMHASEKDRDKYVAVLNLRETSARAYWSKVHELVHRIAEPPQKEFVFQRHRLDTKKPIERLVDGVAAEVAFYAPLFKPLVEAAATSGALSIELIEQIRQQFAPTASLESTISAVVNHWPGPAVFIRARYRPRKGRRWETPDLRVTVQPNVGWRNNGAFIFPNMRVPVESPIYQAATLGDRQDGVENLSTWTTSDGRRVESRSVFTSALCCRSVTYAVMTDSN